MPLNNLTIKYNPLGRVLAIDVGKKNIGLAISDFQNHFCSEMLQVSANFVSLPKLFQAIAFKIQNWEFSTIVIGFPYNMNPLHNKSAIQKFIHLFYEKLQFWLNNPKMKIVFEDERLTTKASQQELVHIKNNWKNYKDAMAAKIILEIYLSKKINI